MRRTFIGLFLFFGAIVLLSAVLTPWIYWGWDTLFPGADPFRRVFNRVLMITALVLLWPLARFWRIRSWKEVGIGDFREKGGDLWRWFGWGLLTVSGLFVLQIVCGERAWKGTWTALRLLEFFASAWGVGILEEILFRGLLFLALFQLIRERASAVLRVAVCTSLFFATTHYLKAVNPEGDITWLSGWISWGNMLMELGDVRMLALRWVSLLLVGLVLCALAYKRQTLWACMGLHAGWVFGLKVLNHATEWKGGSGNWWFQADILSGLSAEFMLGGVLAFVLWGMKRDGRLKE